MRINSTHGLLGQPTHDAVDLACGLGLVLPGRGPGANRGQTDRRPAKERRSDWPPPSTRMRTRRFAAAAAARRWAMLQPTSSSSQVYISTSMRHWAESIICSSTARAASPRDKTAPRPAASRSRSRRDRSIGTRTDRRRGAVQTHADPFPEDAPAHGTEPCRIGGKHGTAGRSG